MSNRSKAFLKRKDIIEFFTEMRNNVEYGQDPSDEWILLEDVEHRSSKFTQDLIDRLIFHSSIPVKRKLNLDDQVLFEIEQISGNVKENTKRTDRIVRELLEIKNKFDELIETVSIIGSDMKNGIMTSKDPVIRKGRITSIFPDEVVPKFDNPKAKIEYLREKIKEIGPISKRSAIEYDE